ncbi:unnamed protein product [Medioppia subpectinata]|uniref:Exonuclease domain-containing protein n=1 Tax=Medioppia subpectinata TaxID=1979941 RepID=A0A7R9PWB3_9ACAR|nr:unnamed protein product [Medioppia subpectinata]CAG2103151.1 unnamed protein product [Medioppia subpectinata]
MDLVLGLLLNLKTREPLFTQDMQSSQDTDHHIQHIHTTHDSNNKDDEHTDNDNVDTIPTTDPVFSKISKINGFINDMNADQLRQRLQLLDLEVSGSMESCRRRLKSHYKSEAMTKVLKKTKTYYYDIVCVVDFEATCDKQPNDQLIQEIIEFPAVLVDIKRKQIVSTFHEFVRPKSTEKLSQFCTDLTGICQSVVDKSDPFSQVLDKFEKWLHSFVAENDIKSYALATDGAWDMSHFFAQSLSLDQMLTHLGMEFNGRQHSGRDDALNIANLLIRMTIDGANPTINQRISWHNSKRKRWEKMRCGFVRVFDNKPSDGHNVSDSEESNSESNSEVIDEKLAEEQVVKN